MGSDWEDDLDYKLNFVEVQVTIPHNLHLDLVKGGRWHMITQAVVYTTQIRYCFVGGDMHLLPEPTKFIDCSSIDSF